MPKYFKRSLPRLDDWHVQRAIYATISAAQTDPCSRDDLGSVHDQVTFHLAQKLREKVFHLNGAFDTVLEDIARLSSGIMICRKTMQTDLAEKLEASRRQGPGSGSDHESRIGAMDPTPFEIEWLYYSRNHIRSVQDGLLQFAQNFLDHAGRVGPFRRGAILRELERTSWYTVASIHIMVYRIRPMIPRYLRRSICL